MYIIKPGNHKEHYRTIRFDCRLCGCSFLAFDDEFEIKHCLELFANTYSKDAYATCPNCGATVIVYDVED